MGIPNSKKSQNSKLDISQNHDCKTIAFKNSGHCCLEECMNWEFNENHRNICIEQLSQYHLDQNIVDIIASYFHLYKRIVEFDKNNDITIDCPKAITNNMHSNICDIIIPCNTWIESHASDHSNFNIVIVGQNGIGKQSLTDRFIHDFYNQYESYEDSTDSTTILEIPSRAIPFQITSMHSELINFTVYVQSEREYENSLIFDDCTNVITLVCFDLTNAESFFTAVQLIDKCKIQLLINGRSFGMILVGCKCDLTDEREVLNETIMAIVNAYNLPYIETSAKDKINNLQPFLQSLYAYWIQEELR